MSFSTTNLTLGTWELGKTAARGKSRFRLPSTVCHLLDLGQKRKVTAFQNICNYYNTMDSVHNNMQEILSVCKHLDTVFFQVFR